MRIPVFIPPRLPIISEETSQAGGSDAERLDCQGSTGDAAVDCVQGGGSTGDDAASVTAPVRSQSATELALAERKLIIPRNANETLPASNKGFLSHKSTAFGTMQLILGSCELPPSEQKNDHLSVLYEERPLCHLIGVTEPTIVITSKPVDPAVIGYYLGLRGARGQALKSLIDKTCVLNASDETAHNLSLKVMGNDKLLGVVHSLTNTNAVKVICHSGSENIDSLTTLNEGFYHDECDSALLHLGTKTGNRTIFEAAGVRYPAGVPHPAEDKDIVDEHGFLMSEDKLAQALARQIERAGFIKEWIVKLNEGVAGRGNAHLTLDDAVSALSGGDLVSTIRSALRTHLKPFDETLTARGFINKVPETGVIAEVFVKGEVPVSPSYQGFINFMGDVETVATHEQVLEGQTYKGCKYPADQRFCQQMIAEGEKIGKTMAQMGARGHFGVDFLVSAGNDRQVDLHAIEINLRNTGTSYPFATVIRLTGGKQAEDGDGIVTDQGQKRYYSASDYVITEQLRGVSPARLISAVKKRAVHWNPDSETGVVFHLFGLLEATGRIGATAIAPSREAADTLLAQTKDILVEIGNSEKAKVVPDQWV